MKSPITGKEMVLTYEWKTIPFRKESFKIKYQFYLCEDSKEHFTTTELDTLNMRLIHNLYRSTHHIPSAIEIKEIRESYGLSAARMGAILGFGPNTYRKYERGDVPSIPNSNLLKTAKLPTSFKNLVSEWAMDEEQPKLALLKKVNNIIDEQSKNLFEINLSSYLMGNSNSDEFSGFKIPSLEKLSEMVVFFAHKSPCYKTKMNKLLFYADFLFFKNNGNSMSGARYRAIPYGPVPNSFESIFEKLAKDDLIDSFYEELPSGSLKEELKGREDRPFNPTLFTESEMQILEKVVNQFRDTSTSDITNLSHTEVGWLENNKEKALINYHYAFDLKAI